MKRVLLLCLFSLIFGCATVQTDTAKNANLTSFKRAYIEMQQDDEFQIYRALFWEMNDMGLEVVGIPFKDPTEQDLLVTYSYDGGWDMTRYLQSFQIRFTNAKTTQVVATSAYRSRGLWRGVRDGRLEEAFNDIRAKSNLPPTKQFGTPQ